MRSYWKLPYISKNFFNKKYLNKETFNVHIRHSLIPSNFIGKKIRIYNGRWNLVRDIVREMIGCRFGEFAFPRETKFTHKQKKKKGKKKVNFYGSFD